MKRKASFPFAFRSFIRTFDNVEGTATWKWKEKRAFLLHFARLFVPLQAIYEHTDETTISMAIAFGISADATVVVVARSWECPCQQRLLGVRQPHSTSRSSVVKYHSCQRLCALSVCNATVPDGVHRIRCSHFVGTPNRYCQTIGQTAVCCWPPSFPPCSSCLYLNKRV